MVEHAVHGARQSRLRRYCPVRVGLFDFRFAIDGFVHAAVLDPVGSACAALFANQFHSIVGNNLLVSEIIARGYEYWERFVRPAVDGGLVSLACVVSSQNVDGEHSFEKGFTE